MSTFDLATLDCSRTAERGAVMTLAHPVNRQPLADGEGKPITITLAGQDSDVYRRAQRAITDKRLALRGRARLSAEDLEAEAVETLARCTLGWSGIVLDGKPLECGPASARALYQRLPWVREQADEFIGDRGNYLGN
ncbi:MAG: hypothetical protein K2Q10_10905 [Rhodospirillales bacterium]|nr:hypothetical protein [Rhodospirillales bacterium]